MPISSNKNLSLGNSVGSVGRAQNFSSTNLGRESIKDARVSANQVARAKAGKGYNPGTTSIFHVGEEKKSNKVNADEQSMSEDEELDEVRDRIRYQHIRDLSEQRKEEDVGKNVYDIGLKTGGQFRSGGRNSIKRKLAKLYQTSPASYKNISKKDREYFQDVVKKHAKKVSIGSGFGRLAKRKMKLQVERDRRKGTISYDDAKDMKRMVNQMPKQTRAFK